MQELNYLGAQIGKLSHRTSSLITFHPLVRVVKALVLFWFLLCIIQFHHLFLGWFLKAATGRLLSLPQPVNCSNDQRQTWQVGKTQTPLGATLTHVAAMQRTALSFLLLPFASPDHLLHLLPPHSPDREFPLDKPTRQLPPPPTYILTGHQHRPPLRPVHLPPQELQLHECWVKI